jgi:heat shock protein HslJ
MMLCEGPAGANEAAFTPALQGATSWMIDGDGDLHLAGAGDIVATPSAD